MESAKYNNYCVKNGIKILNGFFCFYVLNIFFAEYLKTKIEQNLNNKKKGEIFYGQRSAREREGQLIFYILIPYELRVNEWIYFIIPRAWTLACKYFGYFLVITDGITIIIIIINTTKCYFFNI